MTHVCASLPLPHTHTHTHTSFFSGSATPKGIADIFLYFLLAKFVSFLSFTESPMQLRWLKNSNNNKVKREGCPTFFFLKEEKARIKKKKKTHKHRHRHTERLSFLLFIFIFRLQTSDLPRVLGPPPCASYNIDITPPLILHRIYACACVGAATDVEKKSAYIYIYIYVYHTAFATNTHRTHTHTQEKYTENKNRLRTITAFKKVSQLFFFIYSFFFL